MAITKQLIRRVLHIILQDKDNLRPPLVEIDRKKIAVPLIKKGNLLNSNYFHRRSYSRLHVNLVDRLHSVR